MSWVELSGDQLRVETVVGIARDPGVKVSWAPEAMARVADSYEQVLDVAKRYASDIARPDADPPAQDYGITTGFGEFKNIPVASDDLDQLQLNLLYSHAVGIGDSPDETLAVNYYSADVVRATLVLRLNTFLRGNSGVSPELVKVIAELVNLGVIPRVPLRGSVGSSGDLAPLAHLFGILVGMGDFVRVQCREDIARTGLPVRSADTDLPRLLGRDQRGLRGLIGPKSGLALTNGAAFSAAMLALGAYDAQEIATVADCSVALTVEAICGCARAFDPAVHLARPHPGQITSAANVRALISGSAQVDRSDAVQDAYSVRCAPQVRGASRQAIRHALEVAEIEINAATDNPLIFPDYETPWDEAFRHNRPTREKARRLAFSAGNFHGQPVALAADYLTIALAELGNVSERRTQMLLDSHHNRNLPPNLVGMPGLNCGLMITQYAAASLVSENKVLSHPASVDSIPTSANTEDHVAMANHAARKALRVLANVQAVLAIELIAAAQAIDWRVGMKISPTSVPPAEATSRTWRDIWAEQRAGSAAFAASTGGDQTAVIAARLGSGSRALYTAVRTVVDPLVNDRPLDGDIRAVWRLIRTGRLQGTVRELLQSETRERP